MLSRIGRLCSKPTRMASSAAYKPAVQYFEHDFDHSDLKEDGSVWERTAQSQLLANEANLTAASPNGSLRAWQRFHAAHRGSFYHPRSYIAAAYTELCIQDTAALSRHLQSISADAGRHYGAACGDTAGTPLTILELGAGNGSNLFSILEANPTCRLFASDFSRAALKFISRVACTRPAPSSTTELSTFPHSTIDSNAAYARTECIAVGEAVCPAEGAAAHNVAGTIAKEVVKAAASLPAAGVAACPPPFTLFLYDCVTGTAPPPSELSPPESPRSGSSARAAGKGAGKASKGKSKSRADAAVSDERASAASEGRISTDAAVLPVEAKGGCGAGVRTSPEAGLAASASSTCTTELYSSAAGPVDRTSSRSTAGVDWSVQPAIVNRGCDMVLCTFVLSAIAPELQLAALRNMRRLLRPGAVLLFRDYGLYDAAMLRARPASILSPRVHVRGEGTLACYFEPAQLNELLEQAGFALLEPGGARYCTVRARNRRLELEMKRVFVTAKAVALPDALLPPGHPDRPADAAAEKAVDALTP